MQVYMICMALHVQNSSTLMPTLPGLTQAQAKQSLPESFTFLLV